MMGVQATPERLFYDFCIEDHVPDGHLLRRNVFDSDLIFCKCNIW